MDRGSGSGRAEKQDGKNSTAIGWQSGGHIAVARQLRPTPLLKIYYMIEKWGIHAGEDPQGLQTACFLPITNAP